MVTVITKTIGPTGRDYASFALAEADVPNIGTSADLVTNDEAIVFEVDPVTFTASTPLTIASLTLTTDATRNVSYIAASGQPVYEYSGTGQAIEIDDPYTRWSGIDVTASLGGCFLVRATSGYGTAQAGSIIENATLSASATAVQCTKLDLGQSLGTVSEPITLRNLVTKSVEAVSQTILGSGHTTGAHILVVNCTHLGQGSTVAQAWTWSLVGGMPAASFKIINCANLARNASSDANITGGGVSVFGSTNNIGNAAAGIASFRFDSIGGGIGTQLTPTTNIDPGPGNFAVFKASTGQLAFVAANNALNQGVGPSGNSAVPTTGIDGNPRAGSTTQPGAFAGVFFPPTPIPPKFRALDTATTTKFPGFVTPRSSPSLGRVFAWHNWAQPFSVRSTYETEVTFGTYQADEEFVALQVRPSRTLTASYLEGDQLGSHLEQLVVSASPRAAQTFSSPASYSRSGLGLSWKMPLECDAVEVTAATLGGSLAGDFAYRRFFVGAEVFVAPPGRQTISLGGAQYAALAVTVNSVAADYSSIEISAPITLDTGWKVMPLVDCVPLLEAEFSYQTAKVLEVELQGVEYPGASALPPSVSAGQVPAGVETFTDATGISRMVLPPGQNWEEGMSVGIVRAGTEGRLPRLAGAKPYWRLTVQDRVFSRAEWWSLLQMFDAHSGGARSMWVIDPRALTNSAQRGAGNNSIILPELGVLDEFIETTPAIAYQLPDGTWHISELGTPGSNDWDIPVVNALGGTGNLGCVHRAFVGRFTGGGFDESWTSWDICNVSYEIIQTDGQYPNELEVPA